MQEILNITRDIKLMLESKGGPLPILAIALGGEAYDPR
jgi:hypothetical protein